MTETEYGLLAYDMLALSYPELPYRNINIYGISFNIGLYLYNKQNELLVVDDRSEGSDSIYECYWYKNGNIHQSEYKSNIYYEILQVLNGQVSQQDGFKLTNQDNLFFKLRKFNFDHALIKIMDVDLFYDTHETDYIPVLEEAPFKISVDDANNLIKNNFTNFNNPDNLPIVNKFGGFKFEEI